MIEHVLTIKNRKISCDNDKIIANGSKTDSLTIKTDEEWTDCKLVLILYTPNDIYACVYEDDFVYLPEKIIGKPGYISVSVIGQRDDGYRVTTKKANNLLNVISSGLPF